MSFHAASCLVSLLIVALASPAQARQAAPGGVPTANGATLMGTVADPDGAVIPGATVTLTAANGNAIVIKSQSDGTYVLHDVRPGTYSETVTMLGFASFVKLGLRVTAGQWLTIDAKMVIQQQNQQVNVNADAHTISTDPDSNASATVIKGKDLDALSDDPDELSSELTALAGPAAGPSGGQIYVDGFTGGQLPPKSSIREIRINQNPFSAQYDRVGNGRVEVFTKPGTDSFHGFFQTSGNANFLNTGSPFLDSSQVQPYHTIFIFGSETGPISKRASFSLGGSHRVIEDNSIFVGQILADSSASTSLCPPGTSSAPSSCSAYQASIPILVPQVRTDFTPRVDLQLSQGNTLTVRYQYVTNSQHNDGIGQVNLPSTGYNLDSTENELQMTDSQIISARMINETRFEYERDLSTQNPLSTAPSVTVQGDFTGGGSNTQTVNDHQDHLEVQNYSSIALASNFIRFGGRLRSTRDANYSNSQSAGIFSYGCLQPTETCTDAYSTGLAQQYIVAKIAQPSVHATLSDLGLYAENDWKTRPNLTISYGLRYESQNHIRDHHDFAPRVSLAYGTGTRKGTPQTVIHGGVGIFFDRFTLTNVITTLQENGVSRQVFTVASPGPSCTPTTQTALACGTSGGGTLTTYTLAPNLRSSYLMQGGIGFDEQLGKLGKVSINYIASRGVHEFNSQDVNAPVPQSDGTIVPNSPAAPYLYQFASNGVFRQNQISINPTIAVGRKLSIWGYYALNYARADSSGSGDFPSVAYNLGADYGRASFDLRNQLFAGANLTLPYRINLSPLIAATSGHPFNIVTGTDLNGDGILSNDRPALATCGVSSGSLVATSHGCFDTNPAPGMPRIPVNSGTGPASFALNLRVVKTIGFGSDTHAKVSQAATASQPSASAAGGPTPGIGRGGGGPRGGGPFGGSSGSRKRYSLTIGVLAANLFNDVDRNQPSGVVTSPEFYRSTALAGQFFTSNSAVRRVTLQASFSF